MEIIEPKEYNLDEVIKYYKKVPGVEGITVQDVFTGNRVEASMVHTIVPKNHLISVMGIEARWSIVNIIIGYHSIGRPRLYFLEVPFMAQSFWKLRPDEIYFFNHPELRYFKVSYSPYIYDYIIVLSSRVYGWYKSYFQSRYKISLSRSQSNVINLLFTTSNRFDYDKVSNFIYVDIKDPKKESEEIFQKISRQLIRKIK